jgi:hypothetical protein
VERRRGREFEVLESCAWTVDWATRINKAHTAFVKCMYMEGGHHRIWVSLRGGGGVQGPRSRLSLRAGCGLGNRHQQSIYRTCKTYVRTWRGVRTGSEQACEGGEVSKVLETPRADCGMGNRHYQGTYSICKMYIHRSGSSQVRMSLRGGEVSKALETLCVDCGLCNRHQQSAHSIHKIYVHGWGSERGLNRV